MYKLYVACDISGETFSPKKFNLGFSEATEPGEICKIGKYKNKPNPFGRAVLSFEWKPGEPIEKNWNIRKSFIELIKSNLKSFRESGATDIHLYMSVAYDTQCNFAFSAEELREIGDLGIPLLISVYQEDSE